MLTFARAPVAVTYVGPKVHAHLSPFSFPLLSYHAFRLGSDTVSASSWEITEIIPSAPDGVGWGVGDGSVLGRKQTDWY